MPKHIVLFGRKESDRGVLQTDENRESVKLEETSRQSLPQGNLSAVTDSVEVELLPQNLASDQRAKSLKQVCSELREDEGSDFTPKIQTRLESKRDLVQHIYPVVVVGGGNGAKASDAAEADACASSRSAPLL